MFSFSVPLGNRADHKLSSLFFISKTYVLIHDKKLVGIKIKFYNLDTFKKQVDANCIDLDGEFVDLNYNFVSLIFCHLWLSIRCCHFSGSPRVYLQSLNMSLLGHCSYSRCLINFWTFFFF